MCEEVVTRFKLRTPFVTKFAYQIDEFDYFRSNDRIKLSD